MSRKETAVNTEDTQNFTASMPNAPVMVGEGSSEVPSPSTPKRAFKLTKDLAKYPGKVAITVNGGARGEMIFDPSTLPENVQNNLKPFGLGHKLGDSAAGLSGVEAETAIVKVFEGLEKGDWAVRAPATPKVSLAELASNYANLNDEQKAAAAATLRNLGISVPGITD